MQKDLQSDFPEDGKSSSAESAAESASTESTSTESTSAESTSAESTRTEEEPEESGTSAASGFGFTERQEASPWIQKARSQESTESRAAPVGEV